jgi:hypothetical protein
MRSVIIVLEIIAIAVAVYWWSVDGGIEPIVTLIVLTGALIGSIYSLRKIRSSFNQQGGKNSKNFQAKGDININIDNAS